MFHSSLKELLIQQQSSQICWSVAETGIVEKSIVDKGIVEKSIVEQSIVEQSIGEQTIVEQSIVGVVLCCVQAAKWRQPI